MRRFVLLALVLLTGCVSAVPFPGPVHFPSCNYFIVWKHPDSIATSAANDWQRITGLTLTWIPTAPQDCPNCIFVVPSTTSQLTETCISSEHTVTGCTYALPYITDSSILMIAMDQSDDMMGYTWRHELGHAMGLLHTGPGTVMHPHFSEAAHVVTNSDIEQWKERRGL